MCALLVMMLAFESDADRRKFEYLYEKYKGLLLHKAYGVLHDYMLAEDAVSEAYIRVYRNLDKIGDPTSNRSIAFLVTITKNTALTMLAKQKNAGIPEEPDEEAADDFDLERHVLSEVSGEELRRVIDGLGEELKAVFLLKYAHDLKHSDIGKLLGITENNVTVRLHRAKKKLAEILRREGYVHEKA